MKSSIQIKSDKPKNIFNVKTKKSNCLKYNYNNVFNLQKKGELKSINNNYESEEILSKKIKIENSQNNDNTNSFYFNNKINYLSQGNSSSLEFVKNKYKNKSHNINNNHENKDLFLMNKYSPGYIYYKAYQNIIEKLNKKKIQSGKILFRKNPEKKIINNKKRYKSGTINKIFNSNNNNFSKTNYKTNYILKNTNYKSSKKTNQNETNLNHIFKSI